MVGKREVVIILNRRQSILRSVSEVSDLITMLIAAVTIKRTLVVF